MNIEKWQQYQVYVLGERFDRRGHEVTKDRPWAVVSEDSMHSRQIFMACPDTSSPRSRGCQNLLVPAPEANARVDVQQLWTHSSERYEGGICRAELSATTVFSIKEKLLRHLSRPAEKSAFIGRVFWVDFRHPATSTISEPQKTKEEYEKAKQSDLHSLKLLLATELGEPDWEIPSKMQLACLCIASDEFETDDLKRKLLPLITLVPLLHLPNILEKYKDVPEKEQLPTVTIPHTSKVLAGQKRVAVTQCVFTVDYGQGRIFRGGEKGILSWLVNKTELMKVRHEVKEWLGLIQGTEP